MLELWYGVTVLMLTGYVLLDGFDLGAGALHMFVARSDAERRQVLAAIGPYWDGNEVWLVVAGGVLLVAFPRVLSGAISGFYFAIFLVVWSLIFRGISIEFRGHVASPVWRTACDFFFAVPSVLLPLFFGAALGNLLRGLPVDEDGWFALTLFTDFSANDPVGILDWYTILVGVFALVALVGHGAAYLVWRTDGPVRERSRRAGLLLFPAIAALWPVLTAATQKVDPVFFPTLAARPLALALAVFGAVGLVTAFVGLVRQRDRLAFAGSSAFLAGLSAATATCVYPVMLRARGPASRSITIGTGGGDPEGLKTALVWFAIGFPLVIVYYGIVHRIHRGKIPVGGGPSGYGNG
jgi:cytochrome d ubiquinol oxidase subunit II